MRRTTLPLALALLLLACGSMAENSSSSRGNFDGLLQSSAKSAARRLLGGLDRLAGRKVG